MRQKDLRKLAKQIAKLEKTSRDCTPDEKPAIEEEIMRLSSHVDSIEDLMDLDEMVMDLLA